MQDKESAFTSPLNSPLEIGLRALILLSSSAQSEQSVQQLALYDYLMLHSGDIQKGPPSLHPALPNRTGEWLLKREILEKGLSIMVQKELAMIIFAKDGIYYSSTSLTKPFIEHFKTTYAEELVKRANWVMSEFGHLSDKELLKFMTANVTKWGRPVGVVHRNKIFA